MAARFGEASLAAVMEVEAPPTDWLPWLELVQEVEMARAGGRTDGSIPNSMIG